MSRAADAVQICVADWEIECCAPSPVVGRVTEWALEYVAAEGTADPLLDQELLWSVSAAEDGVVRLGRDPVVAFWPLGGPAPPPPGLRRLTGRTWGTVHVAPPGIPPCRGRVERIRVLSQEYREGEPRYWHPVPGTVSAVDVAEGPQWFGQDATAGGPTAFGLLLDLRVDPRLPRPPGG